MLHLQRATRTQSISHAATLFISLLVTTATVAHAATAVRELERSRLSSSPVAARQHGSLCAQWAVAVLTSPARCGSDLASFDSPSRRRKILGLIGLQCSPPSWMLQLDPSMADREGFIAIASSSGGWGKLTSAQLLCRGQGPRGWPCPCMCMRCVDLFFHRSAGRSSSNRSAITRYGTTSCTAARFTRPFRPPPIDRSDETSGRIDRCWRVAATSEWWRRPQITVARIHIQ